MTEKNRPSHANHISATDHVVNHAADHASASDRPTEVDLLAEAKNAQWTSQTFLGANAIKLIAPAKVNLFLGIGKKLPSGYHEVTNVMHALALHDVFYMNCLPEEDAANESCDSAREHQGNIQADSTLCSDKDKTSSKNGQDALLKNSASFACAGPDKNIRVFIDIADRAFANTNNLHFQQRALDVAPEDNLVFKAIDALAQTLNRTEKESMLVHLEKHIPHQAGLGGGSADAAAALVGAAHFWDIGPQDERVLSVAKALGADVAFFLEGGCALYTGIGEHLKHKMEPMRLPIVLVKPDAGVPTAEAYQAFDRAPVPIPVELELQTQYASCAEEVPLFNNLSSAAESILPELSAIRAWLESRPEVAEFLTESELDGQGSYKPIYSYKAPDALTVMSSDVQDGELDDRSTDELSQFARMEKKKAVLLCGSGSSTFAIVHSAEEARRIVAEAQKEGWWARATSLSALKAQRL